MNDNLEKIECDIARLSELRNKLQAEKNERDRKENKKIDKFISFTCSVCHKQGCSLTKDAHSRYTKKHGYYICGFCFDSAYAYKKDTNEKKTATKHDQEKPTISLIPYEFTMAIAGVLTFGAKKYTPFNWAKGFEYSRLISATLRHVGAFQAGENEDQETKLSHLAHAVCCLMFLFMHQKFNLGTDDRFVFNKKNKV